MIEGTWKRMEDGWVMTGYLRDGVGGMVEPGLRARTVFLPEQCESGMRVRMTVGKNPMRNLREIRELLGAGKYAAHGETDVHSLIADVLDALLEDRAGYGERGMIFLER